MGAILSHAPATDRRSRWVMYLVLELEPGHRAGTMTDLSGTGARTWSSGRDCDSPIWYWSSNLVTGKEPRLTYLVLELKPGHQAGTVTHLSGTRAQTWSSGRDCDSPIWYWNLNLMAGLK